MKEGSAAMSPTLSAKPLRLNRVIAIKTFGLDTSSCCNAPALINGEMLRSSPALAFHHAPKVGHDPFNGFRALASRLRLAIERNVTDQVELH